MFLVYFSLDLIFLVFIVIYFSFLVFETVQVV